jgi:hypothetical protein
MLNPKNTLVRCNSPEEKREVREWFEKQGIYLWEYLGDDFMAMPMVGFWMNESTPNFCSDYNQIYYEECGNGAISFEQFKQAIQ